MLRLLMRRVRTTANKMRRPMRIKTRMKNLTMMMTLRTMMMKRRRMNHNLLVLIEPHPLSPRVWTMVMVI